MISLDTIYNEDCLVGMQRIPDGMVDAIITDLPYEVLHRDNPNAQWDRMLPLDKLWEQFNRIIKDNGAILLFCQGMFTAELMMSNRKMWRYNLVWDKCRVTSFLNANRMPMRCHEDIAVFYKSLPTYNPQYIDGEPNHSQGNGIHKETNRCYGRYGRNYQGRTYEEVPRVASTVPDGKKLPRSIIAIKKEHESTVIHPTQKPVDLLRYLILTYTNPGGGNSGCHHRLGHDCRRGHHGAPTLYRLRDRRDLLPQGRRAYQRAAPKPDTFLNNNITK